MGQFETKLKMDIVAQSFEARTKYAVLGGKISGKVQLKYADKQFSFKNTDGATKDTLELTAKIDVGKTADIEAKKNGESMWTYKTQRTTVSNNAKFKMTLNTQMTLNSKSRVHQFLSKNYPYGAFSTRNNKVKIFVDRQNNNLVAPKFKIDVHLQKDGAKAADMTADTTGSPYVFKLTAPNFFKRWGIKQSSIDITADHKIGSSLVVDANILGGLHLEGKRGDNAKNGRNVSLLVKKGGVQMFKITWSTEKINNANEFKFILHDTLDVNPESMLYKNIISQYKILTPFNSRVGEFEIYVNKKDKNLVLNKFYAKGNVMKDGNKRFNFLLTTNEKPYKFELFAPSMLGKLKPGMTEAKISADHNPGQSLEIKTNFEKFTGLKIYKSGSGNERKVEVNGKELATGDYTLTDNSFSTKITLGNDYLEPKITWQGKLPNSRKEKSLDQRREMYNSCNLILRRETKNSFNSKQNSKWTLLHKALKQEQSMLYWVEKFQGRSS